MTDTLMAPEETLAQRAARLAGGRETLAQRAARLAGATEPLSQRAARLARARGNEGSTIDLGADLPTPTVTAGPIRGVGIDEPTFAAARAGQMGIAPSIQANLRLPGIAEEHPELAAKIQRDANKIAAPGLASTTANVALANMAAPLFPHAADAATDAALDRYTVGGGNPGEHANLLGTAAMGGTVAGGMALGAATAPGAAVAGDVAGQVAPTIARKLASTAAGRIVQHAATAAAVNAPLGAVTGYAESDAPDMAGKAADALSGAGHAAVSGAAAGGVLGGLSEAAGGVLAARAERLIAERKGLPPAHSVTLPDVLDSPKGVELELPSQAAQAVRPQVDAMAKAGRPTPEPVAKAMTPEAAMRASIAHRGVATHPDVSPEIQALAAKRANELRPDLPAVEPGAPPPPEPDDWLDTPHPEPTLTAATPPAPDNSELFAAGERHAGLPISTKLKASIKNAYRSAFVTPYAEIEGQAPDLAATLNAAGAASKRAQHISERRLPLAMEGLTEEQRGQFGTKLVHDNLVAEAERKTAAADNAEQRGDPTDQVAVLRQAADNFTRHAAEMAPRVKAGIEKEPWFTDALDKYKTTIERPLRADALRAGVDPSDMRTPASAYVRLASEARLNDAEIKRALDVAGVKDINDLKPRSAAGKALLGENPVLARYFAQNATGPRQGPLAQGAGESTTPRLGPMRKTTATGSAKMATGSAESYATDLDRIVSMDAHDKAIKSARNQVYAEVEKAGRPLAEGENVAPGKKVLSFTDTKGIATGDDGVHRVEVTPEIHDAVTRFHQGLEGRPTSAAGRALKTAGSIATRAQISGMPVEATSHMNTLASVVASVPGEKDVAGKVMAAVPGLGAKAAAVREMVGLDFTNPETRALENRLADAGALRIESHTGGLLNSSHHALFGPEGVDVRGRLVLARKLLDRNPEATNEELRQFITGKLGNYISENSGAATNALQNTGLSSFARFQAARIPTSIKSVVGESDLPASSTMQKVADAANTLYRGPVGHLIGSNAMNYALTGHSTFGNEKGHDLDVDTGLYAVDGAIKHLSPEEATALGDKASPLYVPGGTLNPIAVGGLRSSGLRAMLLSDREGSGRFADAVRDYTNTGLGVMSPMGRAIFTTLTGRVPYVSRGGDFMKVTDAKFNKDREFRDRVKAAASQANPAVHAFAETGGGGKTMSQALSDGDKPLGGPASAAAKVAEFVAPRLLTPGVGGRTNEQSTAARDDRELKDAMTDYTRRVRNASSPTQALKIIDEAADDAASDGRFDPEAIRRTLRRALMLGPESSPDDVAALQQGDGKRIREQKRDISTERTQHKFRIRPSSYSPPSP